ncbi:ATP-binding protein [Lapillicoccus jejuensis]|uniref:ATPase family protein associated with various cellular activities (AAA) n=1 Tax=Lapillicoccus jejuensis TaxID=402171 RepID=A0A542E047_9MICO|nr:ATP-binding protein [Lapillicoccus jejuensis]TQJ08703.1 ATPase family protein associated with various cellular activities (AAA) [Lapillicoccus jejuensis]
MGSPLVESLTRAVEAAPGDVPLRLHLAELLLAEGQQDAAVGHCAVALQHDPANGPARVLMARAMGVGPLPAAAPAAPEPTEPTEPTEPRTEPRTESSEATTHEEPPTVSADRSAFDWRLAESDVADVAPEPMFLAHADGEQEETDVAAFDVERSTVTLADVGGMTQVKERLTAAFLAPMRNPELRRLYGKSLRGGMLLYGPPGCGKTFIGRAVAGEMGAHFISVGLADVLDMYIGTSERNVADLFRLAREKAPVVLFLDEIDALGQKRSLTRNSGMRTTVNQLLTELDGVSGQNEGVFVIGATNQPWDVDPALRRPGRLDRMLLVLPPDREAREAIFRHHLAHRPVEGIDLRGLAKRTDGFSGADIAHVCETASEKALLDGVRTGTVRMIGMRDLDAALAEVRPSTGAWFDSARNVVQFANEDGTYDELRSWMKQHRRL